MPTFEIPSVLRRFTGGKSKVEVEGPTLAQALDALEVSCPGIKARLIAPSGDMHRYVGAFIDGEDVRSSSGLHTPLARTAVVSLIVAVAGG